MQRFLLLSLFLARFFHISSSLFTDVTSAVGLADLKGNVAAFADFNGDKDTDIFVIVDSAEGQCVEIFLWDASIQKFFKSAAKVCTSSDKYRLILHDRTFVNVAPGDFDGDGCVDIIITAQKGIYYEEKEGPRSMYVFWGNSKEFTDFGVLNGTSGKDAIRDQPLVMDVNGDMLPDLFAARFNSPTERLYWIASKKRSFDLMYQSSNSSITTGPHQQFVGVNSNVTEVPLLPLALPQSCAFLDLTGDMTADLLVTSVNANQSRVYELWENKRGILTLNPNRNIFDLKVAYVGQSTFVDFDADGKIDHLIPVCSDVGCDDSHIYLYAKGQWIKVLSNDGPIKWRFIPANSSSPDQPMMTLRTGDYNMDGYPDALVVVRLDQKGSPQETVTLLLENVPSGEHNIHALGRTFKVHLKDIISIKDAVTATFFDFYENGNSDLLLVSKKDGNYQLHAIRNDLSTDTNFLKVMVLSGVCYRSCSCKAMPYGVNTPGPFVKYTTTDTNGNPRYGSAAQLSQSSHFALQLPYILFGLGRTPNFVDKLDVGMPRAKHAPLRTHNWQSIIPNSQVIVIPDPLNKPKWWDMKLLVTPSKLVLLTGVSMLGICFFIGLIILFLHIREKRADEKERREEAHKFHFDAM